MEIKSAEIKETSPFKLRQALKAALKSYGQKNNMLQSKHAVISCLERLAAAKSLDLISLYTSFEGFEGVKKLPEEVRAIKDSLMSSWMESLCKVLKEAKISLNEEASDKIFSLKELAQKKGEAIRAGVALSSVFQELARKKILTNKRVEQLIKLPPDFYDDIQRMVLTHHSEIVAEIIDLSRTDSNLSVFSRGYLEPSLPWIAELDQSIRKNCIDYIANDPNGLWAEDRAEVVNLLRELKLATSSNIQKLRACEHDPDQLHKVLSFFFPQDDLGRVYSKEIFEQILAIHKEFDVDIAQRAMGEGLEARERIIAHQHPGAFCETVWRLHYVSPFKNLSEEEQRLIVEAKDLRGLAPAIKTLTDSSIGTPANIGLLIRHPFLYSSDAQTFIWNRLPMAKLNQKGFEGLVNCGNTQAAIRLANTWLEALERKQEVRERERRGREIKEGKAPAQINGAQSIHKESVHQSVSKSAQNLLKTYGKHIVGQKLEECIGKIITRLDELAESDKSLKTQAAKRCIHRIAASDYKFVDNTSKISTRQLLALMFLAIQDESVLQQAGVKPEDAEKAIITGLYEIQRGGNISGGIDNQAAEDNPICSSGTFNKLINAVQGMHPAFEIVFVSPQTISAKLPIVVRKVTKEYLETLSVQESKAKIEDIKSNGILSDELWGKIKQTVEARIQEEFKDIYRPGKTCEDFIPLHKLVEIGGPYTSFAEKDIAVLQGDRPLSKEKKTDGSSEEKEGSFPADPPTLAKVELKRQAIVLDNDTKREQTVSTLQEMGFFSKHRTKKIIGVSGTLLGIGILGVYLADKYANHSSLANRAVPELDSLAMMEFISIAFASIFVVAMCLAAWYDARRDTTKNISAMPQVNQHPNLS